MRISARMWRTGRAKLGWPAGAAAGAAMAAGSSDPVPAAGPPNPVGSIGPACPDPAGPVQAGPVQPAAVAAPGTGTTGQAPAARRARAARRAGRGRAALPARPAGSVRSGGAVRATGSGLLAGVSQAPMAAVLAAAVVVSMVGAVASTPPDQPAAPVAGPVDFSTGCSAGDDTTGAGDPAATGDPTDPSGPTGPTDPTGTGKPPGSGQPPAPGATTGPLGTTAPAPLGGTASLGSTVPVGSIKDSSDAAFKAQLAPGPAGAPPSTVTFAGAKLTVGPQAMTDPVTIGITPLDSTSLPDLDPGMTNVTEGPQAGYQFTPHPYQFDQPVEVSLPYDPAEAAASTSPQDIFTFYYDDQVKCWRPLQRESVDEANHVVVSQTTHFTDMINATVTVPDQPQGQSFDPNQIKGIQAGDPGAAVDQIASPTANNTGDAKLSYPIQVPPGRAGLQPQLGVGYSSSGGDGWLGMGWDLPMQSISVDTRFGVPRYDPALETETYLLGSQQFTPVANRGPLVGRGAEKVFHTRVEGNFSKIVRHGSTPADYTWEITDKSGTRYFYGGAPGSTLTDDNRNVFQWALREVRDRHDNVMRYQTVEQDDPGVTGATEPGRELYTKQITYTGSGDTDGPYTVTFVRDRELGEPRRPDVSIDARGGFKRVTADLLRRIEVRFNGALVRGYDLAYRTGAFNKTLLASIAQSGEDGKTFTTHAFDYYDDIRDGTGAYQAFGAVPWTSPDDNLRNGAVSAVAGDAGEAGALSGSTSTSVGGHLYVGFGVAPTKSGSVGVKAGFSQAEDTGLVALIDVDGDNLPDKVFRTGGGVSYRKNLSAPGGRPRFADTAVPLRNLPGILAQSSSSLTAGLEAYPGPAAVQLDHVDTVSTTDQYFSDVNGDGIADLVNGGTVLFGRVGPDGAPVYGLSADTPVPVGSAPVNAGGVLGNFGAARDQQIDSHPLIDSVRRWTAPFDGTVRVDGPVALVQDTSPARAADTSADGVRVTVQHENDELFALPIGPNDYAPHTPTGVDAIGVHRGDQLYFRVQSGFDGAFDQVNWDPVVSYTGAAADTTDVNGLNPFRYQASTDFTLGGRASTVPVPATGTMHLSGALAKPAVTTDDVTAVITRDGAPVFQQTLAADQTGQLPVDVDIPVQQGQQLQWRIKIDSPIDLSGLSWTPVATYTSLASGAATTDANGNPTQQVKPPYTVDMYPSDTLTAPQQSFTAPATGTLTVVPAITTDLTADSPDAHLVFTVKRRGALLAKRAIDIQHGQVPTQDPLTVPVTAGDELSFDFSTIDPAFAPHLTSQNVQAGLDPTALETVPSALHTAAPEGAFPQPYRGWATVGYNGNRDRANAPIAQGDLVIDQHFRDQLPTSVDPQAQRDAFAANPTITPPKFVQFSPSPATSRWEAGDDIFVTATGASSSRLGGKTVNIPDPAAFNNVTAVPRVSRSTQISLTGSVGAPVGSIGGSVATGDSTSQLDYLDLNGDGFPDVVGAGGVQYTDPTGQLGGTRAATPDGAVRTSHTTTGNVSAGSAARTIATGGADAAPTGTGTANTADAGNELPPLGVGGEHGSATAAAGFDLIDINGDGLPDRVYADGRAALNLGYRFAAPEAWPGGPLNDGHTTSNGLNIGFNTDFYGFAGGASFNSGRSTTAATLADVNGDGLVDRVFDGNPIQVALNTGSGFAPPQPFLGGLPGVATDVNAQLGAGAFVTFSFCFAVITGCVVVNPGADTSTGTSRAEQQLRDINGDGDADMLASTKDNQLTVAENRTGRTNLLKTVHRPLGSSIAMDYTRDGNTYDHPQSRWVLTSVSTNDGHPGDGQDTQHSTVHYAGGVYDRLEREFRGYGTVVTETRDPGANDAVYRTVTDTYRTDSHYTVGLEATSVTADAAGHPFLETDNTYDLRDTAAPASAADPASTTATIFPALSRTDKRYFEGNPVAGKSTHTQMSYDALGNLTRSLDVGEPGPADDVESDIRYSAENGLCQDNYIVGTPIQTTVLGGGSTVLRKRENTVDCTTGDVTRNRAFLADGTGVVTDLTHFDNGNVESVTYPPNATNQRYRIDYTYDAPTATYPATVADIFGLRSATTYNLKYGKPETSTDENGQQQRISYDTVGRVSTVTSPKEIADKRPTIAFEYHPEAAVPYAITRHADREADGDLRADTLDTITFADGMDRMIQTKKDATVATTAGAKSSDVMTVSGRTTLDFTGRAIAQTFPITEPKGAANITFNPGVDTVAPTRIAYDILNRATSTALPDGSTSTSVYGFGTDRAGATGFETAVTDPKGGVKRTFADVRNQATAVLEANPAGGQPAIWTSYTYDPVGETTSVTDDHGSVTTSAYDNLGRRTLVTTPDSGTTRTVYDRADNVISKVTATLTAGAQAITYDYDFTRLTAIRYPTFPGNNVTYTYGAPGAADNAAGRVTQVTDAGGSMTRKYGSLGELTQETRVVHGVFAKDTAYTSRYSYDSFDRMLQLTYPDGEVLSYHYNSGGLVDRATGVKAGRAYPYLKQLDYDKFEERLQLVPGNGTTTSYTYGAADRRLATIKGVLPHGETFQNQSYTYDPVGDVTSIVNNVAIPDHKPGGPDIGGPTTQTFAYDDLDRLTSSQGTFTPRKNVADSYQLSMSYDSVGDITTKNQAHAIDDDVNGAAAAATGGVAQAALSTGISTPDASGVRNPDAPPTTFDDTYTYSATQPHAPSAIGPLQLAYDANGNLTSRTDAGDPAHRRQQVWDEDNRLACTLNGPANAPTVTQSPASCDKARPDDVRYRYDDQGNRVVKDGGPGDVTVYPSQGFSQRGGAAFKHIFIGSTRLVSKMVEPGGLPELNQFYFHPDQLGSTSYGTDARGRLVDHQQYFPSGQTWVDETRTDPTPFQFSGKELDAETGLYYFGARYYDPRTSMWQSTDPEMPAYLDGSPNGGVTTPPNLATYTYAYDNPLRFTDPDGKWVNIVAGAAIGAAISAGIEGYHQYQAGQLSTRRLVAAAAGGAVNGAITGATFGASLLGNAAGNVAGGVVERAINGDEQTLAAVTNDAKSAAIGFGAGKVLGMVASSAARRVFTPAFRRAGVGFQLSAMPSAVKALETMPEGDFVYLIRDAAGTVIYVGKSGRSNAPLARLGEHLATKPGEFLGDASRLEITANGLAGIETDALEQFLIQKFQPKYNGVSKFERTLEEIGEQNIPKTNAKIDVDIHFAQ